MRAPMCKIVFILLFLGSTAAVSAAPEAYVKAAEKFQQAKRDAAAAVMPAVPYADAYDSVAAPLEGLAEPEREALYMEEGGYAEYKVTVSEDSLYSLALRYRPLDSSSGRLLCAIRLNGEFPFKEARELAFPRFWKDADRNYKSIKGNQPFPAQVEVADWTAAACTDSLGKIP